MTQFGLLTTNNHPFISGYLNALKKYKITNYKVIVNNNKFSEKNKKLLKERVGNWDFIEKFSFSNLKTQENNNFIFVDDHNSDTTLKIIEKNNFLFLINAGTIQKLSLKTIESLPMGIINIHPGSIPKYRGQSAPEWALLNNDPIEITAHFMGANYDDGSTLISKEIELSACKSYLEFRRLIYRTIFELAAMSAEMLLNLSLNEVKKLNIKTNYTNKIFKGMPNETLNDLIKIKFQNS